VKKRSIENKDVLTDARQNFRCLNLPFSMTTHNRVKSSPLRWSYVTANFWVKSTKILSILANKNFFTCWKIKLFIILWWFVATKNRRKKNSPPPLFYVVVGSGIRDGKKKIWIRDKHPGSATLLFHVWFLFPVYDETNVNISQLTRRRQRLFAPMHPRPRHPTTSHSFGVRNQNKFLSNASIRMYRGIPVFLTSWWVQPSINR